MNVQDFKQDNDAPKPDVAPETKESLPETTESHAPWAWDKSSKYTIMGYTAARMDTHLVDFIKEYAEKEEKVPGCVDECIEICQVNAMKKLEDLRNLSRRCWLGEYFPANVALRFENALESP